MGPEAGCVATQTPTSSTSSGPTLAERRPIPPLPNLARLSEDRRWRTLEDWLRHLFDSYSGSPSPHASTHLPAGLDALATAAPAALTPGAAGAVGVAESFPRSDHVHDMSAFSTLSSSSGLDLGVEAEPSGNALIVEDPYLNQMLEEIVLLLDKIGFDLRGVLDEILTELKTQPVQNWSGNAGFFAGTTPVVAVTAPQGSMIRLVRSLRVYNPTGAAITVTIKKTGNSGGDVTLWGTDVSTLNTAEFLVGLSGTALIALKTGQTITVELSGAGTTPTFDAAWTDVETA